MSDRLALKQAILTDLEPVWEPGQVAEVRIFVHDHRTDAGYFDDPDRLADVLAQSSYPGRHSIYWTPNPVNPALLARANNRIGQWEKKLTADDDILRRRWLMIDYDPDRPAGISSSEPEHLAALGHAATVRDWLAARGFPAPILADSGNGAHLLYRIDLPNDEESRALLRGCLHALDAACHAPAITTDLSVFNAARIWKIYGTLACKGDSIPERPHRPSRILLAPDTLDVAPAELLRDLAALAPDRASKPTAAPARAATTPSTGKPTLDEIRELLRHIPRQTDYGDVWLRCLMAVHSEYPGPDGVALIEEWSPGKPGEVEKKFDSFQRSDGVGIGTLYHIAKQHGWTPPEPVRLTIKGKPVGETAGQPAAQPAPDLDELIRGMQKAIDKHYDSLGAYELDFFSAQRQAFERLAEANADAATADALAAKIKERWPKLSELLDGKRELESAKKSLATRAAIDEKANQATILLQLAQVAGLTLWHTPDDAGYGTINTGEHREHHRLTSKRMRQWLARLWYDEKQKAIGSQALQDALTVLEGKAVYDGPERVAHVRLAGDAGAIYLDLGTPDWRVVQIDAAGWRLVADPPVHFRRPKGMQPLPVPVPGGRVDLLRKYIHVADVDDWRLIVSWLAATFRPAGPFAFLALYGEQGSGKSTQARFLTSLVDPRTAILRSEPKDARDVAIAASSAWLVSYDNLSSLPQWLSDVLCRLSTGGGFGTRTLYSDDEETLFDVKRPAVFTAIAEVASRDDLLDRCLCVTLPALEDDERREEDELWADFERDRPLILGALLDAVSAGLRNLPATRLSAKPRMADFAKWACAVAPALGWEPQDFLDAYAGNRAAAREVALDAVPWLAALKALALPWKGTATVLLDAITPEPATLTMNGQPVSKPGSRPRGWPANGRALVGSLKRIAPALRATGIRVTFGREGKARTRIIALEKVAERPSAASAASAPSGPADANAHEADANAGGQTILRPPSPSGADAADGADANPPTFSRAPTNGRYHPQPGDWINPVGQDGGLVMPQPVHVERVERDAAGREFVITSASPTGWPADRCEPATAPDADDAEVF